MIFEEKIIYEIKKENYFKARREKFLEVCDRVYALEEKLINEGCDREFVNLACIRLIEIHDQKFRKKLISEGFFSNLLQGTLETLVPGLGDYFKKMMARYVFKKLGINPNSPIASFFVNIIKNIEFAALFRYFQTGNCPLIVETIGKTLIDELLDYLKEQLFVGMSRQGMAMGSEYGSVDASGNFVGGDFGEGEQDSLMDTLAQKIAGTAIPAGFFEFFQTDGIKSMSGQALEEIIRVHIKKSLEPNLIKDFQKIICEELDYRKIIDAGKSDTLKDIEKKEAGIDVNSDASSNFTQDLTGEEQQ